MLLLNRLLALIAGFGLGGIIYTIGYYQYADVNTFGILGAVGVGYVTAMLILHATGSMVEMVMMIGLLSIIPASMVYFAGDTFTAHARLVLWGVVCGAGYAPMILIAIGQWESPERRQELAAKDTARRY